MLQGAPKTSLPLYDDVLMSDQVVSDLEADYPQQQESREEGVEEDKVQGVSGQCSRVTLVDDLTALGQRAPSWERSGTICAPRQRQSPDRNNNS